MFGVVGGDSANLARGVPALLLVRFVKVRCFVLVCGLVLMFFVSLISVFYSEMGPCEENCEADR